MIHEPCHLSASSPEALPVWITADLIHETLRVWQPYYGDRLTERDAIGILLDVGRLFDQLGGE
ncbi:unnamed protein product, partial [Ectocarpus sp. 8 AP-2014]